MICEIHHTSMQEKAVPISYGMFVHTEYDVALRQAQQKSFPHAIDRIEGGCVVGSPSAEAVWECADCRAAKNNWIATEGGKLSRLDDAGYLKLH